MIKNCHMRHKNGNCLPADNFYTTNKNIYETLHNAYELGRKSAQSKIIRCKDCKYNVSSHNCLHPESFFLVPDDDFYCGYAERRTDETD